MFKNMDWVESGLSQVDPASVADDKVQTRKEPIETISHQIKKLMEASRVKKKTKRIKSFCLCHFIYEYDVLLKNIPEEKAKRSTADRPDWKGEKFSSFS